MSLRVLCPNGHELLTEPEHVGRKIRCPACQVVMIVPDARPKETAQPPLPRPAVAESPATLRVLCPNGHELLAEPEHVGRKIRCPACQVVMIVPDPRPQVSAQPLRPPRRPIEELKEVQPHDEPEPEPREDEPRRSKGMKTRKRMGLANLGLGFHYAKIICILVAILLVLVGFGLGIFLRSLGFLQLLSLISNLLVLVTPILGGTGSLLCFWLPAKSNSRVLVMVSFGLEVGGTLLMGIALVMTLTGSAVAIDEMRGGGPPAGGMGMVGAGGILMLLACLIIYASFIMFLLFLRFLADYLRDRATRDEAMRQLIMYLIVTLGGGVLVFMLGFAAGKIGGQGMAILMLFVIAGWLVAVCFVMFAILNVLGTIRQQIATRW